MLASFSGKAYGPCFVRLRPRGAVGEPRCTTAVCKISISVHSHGDESDVVIRIKIIAGHLDFNRFQRGRPITPEPGSSTIIDHYKGIGGRCRRGKTWRAVAIVNVVYTVLWLDLFV